MQFQLSAVSRLMVAAVLIALAFWARGYVEQLTGESRVILNSLPYLVCIVAAFMAYQFGRCRSLLAAVGVATFFWLIQGRLQVSLSQADAARLYLVVSLAVPALILYLLLMPERGIFTTYGLLGTVFFLGLAGLCFPAADWIMRSPGEWAGYFSARPTEGYVLSPGASVLTAVVALVGLLLLLLRNSEAEPALLGVLVATYCALAFLHLDNISVVTCLAAGLCLVWGLLRSSHSMAYRDDLTGLLSRRALNERLSRLGRRYSIAMLDVDHFKRFNDTHGHDVGDEVLKLVASRVRQVGSGGTAYRYGGEEFCIVFPRKSAEDCADALDEVRESIAAYKMLIRDRGKRPVKAKEGTRKRGATRANKSQASVTISAGLAEREEGHPGPEAVMLAADDKLYRAKKAGRNRVVC
jgi:hypothetical protein